MAAWSVTTIQLPHQLPGGGINWRYVQTTRQALTTPAAANGICQVSLGQVPDGEMWLVQRMSVQNTAVGVVFVAYFGAIDPRQVADSTNAGDGDVADEHQPIVLNAGDELLCVWALCPNGAIGSINVQYQLFRSN
jgi:hypothetical protein